MKLLNYSESAPLPPKCVTVIPCTYGGIDVVHFAYMRLEILAEFSKKGAEYFRMEAHTSIGTRKSPDSNFINRITTFSGAVIRGNRLEIDAPLDFGRSPMKRSYFRDLRGSKKPLSEDFRDGLGKLADIVTEDRLDNFPNQLNAYAATAFDEYIRQYAKTNATRLDAISLQAVRRYKLSWKSPLLFIGNIYLCLSDIKSRFTQEHIADDSIEMTVMHPPPPEGFDELFFYD
jgi:hypothetical protein